MADAKREVNKGRPSKISTEAGCGERTPPSPLSPSPQTPARHHEKPFHKIHNFPHRNYIAIHPTQGSNKRRRQAQPRKCLTIPFSKLIESFTSSIKMPAKKKSKKEDEEPKKEEKKEEEEESEEESEEEDSTDDEDRGRGKRKRKSSIEAAFEPVDFTMADKPQVTIVKGRGKKLKEFPTVVASFEKCSTDDALFAHKFLFGNRGSHLKKKELVNNLLEFSGYLKEVPKGYDAKKLDAEDDLEEKKYSMKAFKMVLAQVKRLCDIFTVERLSEEGKPLNKEDTIENLLDFLAQPNADFIATIKEEKPSTKKKASPKKKKKATSTKQKKTPTKANAAPKESFALVRSHEKGKTPSDAALRQWVQAYIVSFDMDSATTKHAIKTASAKFGTDLSASKDRIKELLAEEM